MSTVGLALGLFVALFRWLRVRTPVALATSLLAALAVFPWAYVARPDALYLAILVWATYTFYGFLEARTVLRALLPVALLVLDFYVKQTAVFFLAPIGLACLLLLRTNAERLVFALAAGMLTLLSVAAVPFGFWQNMAAGLANGTSIWTAISAALSPLVANNVLLLVGTAPCVALVLLTRDRRLVPCALLTVWAGALGAVLALKVGSAENYFDELFLFAFLLIGGALPRLAAMWSGPRPVAVGFTLIAALASAVVIVQNKIFPIARKAGPDVTAMVAMAHDLDQPAQHGLVIDLTGATQVLLPSGIALSPPM